MKKNSIIKYIIICAIILAGIIMTLVKGFKFDLNYEAVQQVEIYIGKEFNINDIKSITNEVFEGKDVLIEKVEEYEDTVSIKTSEITDDQKSNLVTKINEKYELETKTEDINIVKIPHTRFIDINKKYIFPLILSLVIILVYVGIRFIKIGVLKSLTSTCLSVILSEAVLMSIVALARIPVGRITTALILLTYVISIVTINANLENELKVKKLEEEKEES